jgi:hypothetical protein
VETDTPIVTARVVSGLHRVGRATLGAWRAAGGSAVSAQHVAAGGDHRRVRQLPANLQQQQQQQQQQPWNLQRVAAGVMSAMCDSVGVMTAPYSQQRFLGLCQSPDHD